MTSTKNSSETPAITVLSRALAEDYVPQPGEICISVTNPRQSPARLKSGWYTVVRLGFHDTDRPGGDFTVMSRVQARAVLEWAREREARPITVHCEHGASRSVAIGVFLAAWLDRPVNLLNDVLAPNPWVIKELRLAALPLALKWLDLRLLRTALFGPLTAQSLYRMMPRSIADTYLK